MSKKKVTKQKWVVTLPITGYVGIEVEADTEDEAIEEALEGDYDWTTTDIEEWQTHRVIAEGNVCYASINYAEAERIED